MAVTTHTTNPSKTLPRRAVIAGAAAALVAAPAAAALRIPGDPVNAAMACTAPPDWHALHRSLIELYAAETAAYEQESRICKAAESEYPPLRIVLPTTQWAPGRGFYVWVERNAPQQSSYVCDYTIRKHFEVRFQRARETAQELEMPDECLAAFLQDGEQRQDAAIARYEEWLRLTDEIDRRHGVPAANAAANEAGDLVDTLEKQIIALPLDSFGAVYTRLEIMARYPDGVQGRIKGLISDLQRDLAAIS